MTIKPKVPPVGVRVNGRDRIYRHHPTVRVILGELRLPEQGVAVAVNGEVFPRSRWGESVPRGSDIEILTAVQGG